MRVAAITRRKIFHAVSAKGVGHASLLIAGSAKYLDIRRFTRYAKLAELEPCPAGYIAMHKADPGKVIQVTIFTCHEKASRHNGWWCTCRGAVCMDIARLVRPVEICLELKQARIQGGQGATTRTKHPTGKGCDGHTNAGTLIERIRRAYLLRGFRWSEESSYLLPQDCTHCL